MSKVIALEEVDTFFLPPLDPRKKRNVHGLSTSDFRRLLSDLRQRPPSQRAFLRKLLRRALAVGAPTGLPAVNHVVRNPVVPT